MLRKSARGLKILFGLGFIVGSSFGGCTCRGDTVGGMEYDCSSDILASCQQFCQSFGSECADASEWDTCPASVLGLSFLECVEEAEGVALDIECDDPLPYKTVEDPDGFEDFACCCLGSNP